MVSLFPDDIAMSTLTHKSKRPLGLLRLSLRIAKRKRDAHCTLVLVLVKQQISPLQTALYTRLHNISVCPV